MRRDISRRSFHTILHTTSFRSSIYPSNSRIVISHRFLCLSLEDSELRALCPRILGGFLLRRNDRFSGNDKTLRLLAAYADRKIRRTGTRILVSSERRFDDAILKRMKRDDSDSPSVIQQIDHSVQRILQRSQLTVQLDPDRLKRPFRRVAACRLHLLRNGSANDRSQRG